MICENTHTGIWKYMFTLIVHWEFLTFISVSAYHDNRSISIIVYEYVFLIETGFSIPFT